MTAPTPNLISYETLVARGINLSKTQLWRKERAGTFPERVRISAGRIAWVESEIETWLAARIAARDIRQAA